MKLRCSLFAPACRGLGGWIDLLDVKKINKFLVYRKTSPQYFIIGLSLVYGVKPGLP
jgi:hypothetical protein